MSADAMILGYVVVLLAAISVVAIYSEHRRRRFEPTPSEDSIFRCEECGFVYTDDRDVERSRCPQCRSFNSAFKF